jgi:hypothetical protein
MTRGALASISMVLFVVAPLDVEAGDSGEPKVSDIVESAREGEPISCGALSLYVLCRLEGCRAPLATIMARLPAESRAGHSLAQIRDAAAACGLGLRGVRIRRSDWPLDRPALIHLDRHTSGHYVVIRPVGHSGRLVQVIDAPNRVETLDFDHLISSPDWTGLALIPRRPNWAGGVGIVLAIAASVLVLMRTVARLRHRHRTADLTPVASPNSQG